MKTAVLHCSYGTLASYYDDWLDGFRNAPGLAVTPVNLTRQAEVVSFSKEIGSFELIILLHSVNGNSLIYARDIESVLKSRSAKLLSFVGNEFSFPGSLLGPKISYLEAIQADYVATQLPLEAGNYLYGETGAKVLAVPHALNPDVFKPDQTVRRETDLGVRSFRYPSLYLGDDDRNRLMDVVQAKALERGLKVDISAERFSRQDWARFLSTSKGTVSNEAGGYWLDKDDATVRNVQDWLARKKGGGLALRPGPLLRRMAHRLPWAVRQKLIGILKKGPVRYEAYLGDEEDFEEVYQRFFASKEFPPKISGKCISSRHFDAIGTKTCQIMMEGRFNDILKADEHYIAVRRDLSNLDEAIERFQSDRIRTRIVDAAYDLVISKHTYQKRIGDLLAKL